MKIAVLMKQVPNKDAVLRVRGDGKWVEEGDLSFEVNESDGYALEEALRLKEKKGGEVVVVTLGPQRAKSVIKDALARGADRAIHVVADDFRAGCRELLLQLTDTIVRFVGGWLILAINDDVPTRSYDWMSGNEIFD